MDIPSSRPFGRSASVLALLALVALLAVVGSGFAGSASAAGSTAVELTPTEASVDPGNATTFAVTVTNADGGVGAYELTLTVGEPSVARIVNVTRLGDPGIGTAEIDGDGASADLEAGLMDTADTGAVTIARVTVEGVGNGTSGIDLAVQALGDEVGARYEVSETRDARLTVGDGSTTDGSTATRTASPTPTSSPTPSQRTSTAESDSSSDAGSAADPDVGTESTPETTATGTAEDATATGTETTSMSTSRSSTTSEDPTDRATGQSPAGTESATTGGQLSPERVSTRTPGFGVSTVLLAVGVVTVVIWARHES